MAFIYSDLALDYTNSHSIKTVAMAFATLSLKMVNFVAVNAFVIDLMAAKQSSAQVIACSFIKVFRPFVAIVLAFDYSY